MSPFLKRAGLVAVAALALGACEYGLGLPEEPVAPGSTLTVTNTATNKLDGVASGSCPVPEPPTAESGAGEPDEVNGVPVAIFLFTDQPDGPGEEPDPIVESFTDAEGFFEETITAPSIPGPYAVLAACDNPVGPEAAAVNSDGGYLDYFYVAHTPLTIAVDHDEVTPGGVVKATFNRCQDDNDLGVPADLADEEAIADPSDDATWADVATDYPDLVVTLDGKPVATIAGTERYPTGTVDVPVTLTEVGAHVIKGVCTYQTVTVDEDLLLEQGSAAAAAITYPLDDTGLPLIFDEATTTAEAPVTVAAPLAVQPVVADVPFTG